MSEANLTVNDETTALDTNSPVETTKKKRPARKSKPTTDSTSKPTRPTKTEREMEAKEAKSKRSTTRTAAYATFAIATALLALSVSHLTEAISALTGTHFALAALLAIGIDAGMLACEAALLLRADSKDKEMRNWAVGYVVSAALASALLNAYAFAQHAPTGMEPASVALGLLIPGLVLALGKVGGKLYLAK